MIESERLMQLHFEPPDNARVESIRVDKIVNEWMYRKVRSLSAIPIGLAVVL